jgi:hypothetical protein
MKESITHTLFRADAFFVSWMRRRREEKGMINPSKKITRSSRFRITA